MQANTKGRNEQLLQLSLPAAVCKLIASQGISSKKGREDLLPRLRAERGFGTE